MPAPWCRFRAFDRCEGTPRSQTVGASFCRAVVAARGAEEKGVVARSAIGGLQMGGVGGLGAVDIRAQQMSGHATQSLDLQHANGRHDFPLAHGGAGDRHRIGEPLWAARPFDGRFAGLRGCHGG